MTGSNWMGLGNGTHALDGFEYDSSQQHQWVNTGMGTGTEHYSDILFFNVQTAASYSRVIMKYNDSKKTYSYTTGITVTPASIQDRLFRSATISGVKFTWSKGADWSRGNMHF